MSSTEVIKENHNNNIDNSQSKPKIVKLKQSADNGNSEVNQNKKKKSLPKGTKLSQPNNGNGENNKKKSLSKGNKLKESNSGNGETQKKPNKKSPTIIPPPLAPVDFGNSSRDKKSVSRQQNERRLPNGEPVNFNNNSKPKPIRNNTQSLPDGKKPDFGHANKNKRETKDESSKELLKMLNVNSKQLSQTAKDTVYAGNSFTHGTPSLISLPKPSF